MALSVTIVDPIDGLDLLSPTAPDFELALRSLFRGNSDELLKLRPFLTIFSNRRDRTLVAYVMKWDLAQHGRKRTTYAHHKYPDAVAGAQPNRGNEIRPGEQKVVAKGIEIDCGRYIGQ